MKLLSELCRNVGLSPKGDVMIHRVVMDSRLVQPGDLFVAYPAGIKFIDSALANGASAVLVPDEECLGKASVGVTCADYENTLWRICKDLYDDPSASFKLVGVTGTNGKTTTAWIMRDLLQALGERAAYIGTLGVILPEESRELANTTPFVVDVYNLMVEARDQGVTALVMEVSSHALAQKRVEGLSFDVGIFTNLTQDHLDFHETMEAYQAAKWRLFTDFGDLVGCFNLDDPVGAKWSQQFAGRQVSFSTSAKNQLQGRIRKVQVDRIEMDLVFAGEQREALSRLGGSYNVSNLLSATSGLLGFGYDLYQVSRVIPDATPVPGRFESIPNRHGVGVLVDYAHTPDALEKLLQAVKPITTGRVITVFGCGGDRDKAKRPIMARIASQMSDLVIVTSDNPRTEDPEQILNDICAGLIDGKSYERLSDRQLAIEVAIQNARIGDSVVIAGKGHEDYQIIGKEKVYFDDRELARNALANLST
jgi:UDP-N-acetylmuramoyl-L-alanyl-D-glutamate--2,6-diaminopimelate ligase